MKTLFSTLVTLLIALSVNPASRAQETHEPQNERANLSGRWRLNEELSESAGDKMREAMSASAGRGGGGRGGAGRGGGGGGGGRGGFGGGSNGGRGGAAGGSFDDPRERMQATKEAYESLIIDHQEPELSITLADQQERIFKTDGSSDGDKAKWKKDGSLVVKAESDRGKRTETWRLSEDGRQLLLTTELPGQGPRPKISFTRVYDPTGSDPDAGEDEGESPAG